MKYGKHLYFIWVNRTRTVRICLPATLLLVNQIVKCLYPLWTAFLTSFLNILFLHFLTFVFLDNPIKLNLTRASRNQLQLTFHSRRQYYFKLKWTMKYTCNLILYCNMPQNRMYISFIIYMMTIHRVEYDN